MKAVACKRLLRSSCPIRVVVDITEQTSSRKCLIISMHGRLHVDSRQPVNLKVAFDYGRSRPAGQKSFQRSTRLSVGQQISTHTEIDHPISTNRVP